MRVVFVLLQLKGGTYHANLQVSGGGVGRNIAEGIAKLSGKVDLITVVGNDQNGVYLKNLLPTSCQRSIYTTNGANSTGNFVVVLDKLGDCKLIMGNTNIHAEISSELIIKNEKLIANSPIVIMDSNLTVDAMGTILDLCRKYDRPVFFEPTDMRIANKPFQLSKSLTKQIKFISPNIAELDVIAKALNYTDEFTVRNLDDHLVDVSKYLENLKTIAGYVAEQGIEHVIVTMGGLGVLISGKNEAASQSFFDKKCRFLASADSAIRHRLYKTQREEKVVNVSGAGDSFNSGFISAMIKGLPANVCVSVGFEASKRALRSQSAVPDKYFDETHSCWSTQAVFE